MASRQDFDLVIPHVDLVIFDLKHSDAEIHCQLTGSSNQQILENLAYLDRPRGKSCGANSLIPGE